MPGISRRESEVVEYTKGPAKRKHESSLAVTSGMGSPPKIQGPFERSVTKREAPMPTDARGERSPNQNS